MGTQNLTLTHEQAETLSGALMTESQRLTDTMREYPDRTDLVNACKRCLSATEYLRGRVDGLLDQF